MAWLCPHDGFLMDFKHFMADGKLFLLECKGCGKQWTMCTGKHYRHATKQIKIFLEQKFAEYKREVGLDENDNIGNK